MKLYQQEFGRHFGLGFNLDDYPFLTDKSYHNDICPSFYFKTAGSYYILWVDYPTASEREDEGFSRYTIVEAENLGDEQHLEIGVNQDSSFQIKFELTDEIEEYLKKVKYKAGL